MSQISGFNAVDDATRTTTNRFNDMSSEDFIQIMFTELSNQDPLQPNDSAALLEQINSIRSIESDLNLTNQLKTLVAENQLASSSNLIGKYVSGLTEGANRVEGFVVSVVRQGQDIAVELDTGWFVPASNVETVIDPSIFTAPDETAGDAGSETDADASASDDDTAT
jgi:flagellar basal-body rod modification protein FlgD